MVAPKEPDTSMEETKCSGGCCTPAPLVAASAVCKSGCCSENANAEQKAMMKFGDVTDEGCTGDGCCSPAEKPIQDDCQGNCCTGGEGSRDTTAKTEQAQVAKQDNCQDKCCSGKEVSEKPVKGDYCDLANIRSEAECQDSCCAGNESEALHEPAPPCCIGKSSPCCDDSCIDRLALRECELTCNSKTVQNDDDGKCADKSCCTEPKGSGARPKPRTACRRHVKAAREKYSDRLAAIGCICRALIALGQESCCISAERPLREKSSVRKRSPPRKTPNGDDSCSASGYGSQKAAGNPRVRSRGPRKTASCSSLKMGCQSSCCDKSGDAGSVPSAKMGDDCSGDSCCRDKSLQQGNGAEAGPKYPGVTSVADVEKGLSSAEHVVLSITGMTCTGCETKLSRTLSTLPHISNLKTSLVMQRAEFNLDPSTASVADVIRHIERTTEFKCEKMATEGTSIDVIPEVELNLFMRQPLPLGINGMEMVGKDTVRIDFDAKVIGARDIVEKTFNYPNPMRLAPPRGDAGLVAGRKHVRHMGYVTLLSAALTIPVLVLAWAPIQDRPIVYGGVSLALATIVQVAIAGPFYPKAIKSLVFSRMIEMDLLIVLSTSAAYIFSVVSFGYLVTGKPLSTGEFFETSTLLVTLIMVGRYVSALARQRAVESISIRSLQASTAILVEKDKATEREIDSRLLQHGDVFKMMPETRVPTDGTVLSGSSEMDESMLTGESLPVEKQAGSAVIAGSINGSGTLTARLTRLPGENTISVIAGMVDDAKLSKPKMQDMADRVATYFVPGVVSLTIVTFIIWIAVGIIRRRQTGSEAAVNAITFAITVLIVSCPCAIGLAVPMVVVMATGVAAQRGVIFKSANSIEIAHKASHVVFDKTGTLTEGKLSVVTEKYLTNDDGVNSNILGLVSNIKHPVSVAMATHLQSKKTGAVNVHDVKSVPGKGVEGITSHKRIRVGNALWLGFESHPAVQEINSRGFTAFCVSIDSQLVAVFGLLDSVREEAPSVIKTLKERGIGISILSGDNHGAVTNVAQQLSIPNSNVKARCTPADKASYIRHLQAQDKTQVVVFVGDGTNDAVALAQATIGVHVNSGTDVAQSAADVVLMRPSLEGIVTMVNVSRAAVRRIGFNFGWSFVYNIFAVLLASGAFVAIGDGDAVRIPPEYAGLGELVSVLPVILAAVALRWARI